MSGRVMDLVVCEPCISYGIQMEPHSRTAVEFALDSAGSPERIFPVDALNERNGIFVYRRPAHFSGSGCHFESPEVFVSPPAPVQDSGRLDYHADFLPAV